MSIILTRWRHHYGRVEAMEWAENNDADYIFGLPGNAALDAIVAGDARQRRAHGHDLLHRRHVANAINRSAFAIKM